MKEEKLFKIMKNVDDDLICEMIDYRPREQETENWQKPIYSARRDVEKKSVWRYSVTAAALLLVVGAAAAFIAHIGGRIPTDTVQNTGSETTEGFVGTIGEIPGTDRAEETDVSKALQPVIPKKVVNLSYAKDIVYTDLYPEIPRADFDEKYFIEMTSEELYDYYGFKSAGRLIKEGRLTEIRKDDSRRGIYKLPDGSVYDINTFTYENKEDDDIYIYGKRFTVTLSKETVFGESFDCDNAEYENRAGKYAYFYNESTRTFFLRKNYEDFGFCILVSGNTDELSDFDSPKAKEYACEFYNGEDDDYWKGVPWEYGLFGYNVFQMNPYIAQLEEENPLSEGAAEE